MNYDDMDDIIILDLTNEDDQSAVVYTTKLDDMKTLQIDLNKYNTKEITQMLLAESKPTYLSEGIHRKPVYEPDTLSYAKVVSVVGQLNFKAQLEAENTKYRNLKLKEQCKPCSVILQDTNSGMEAPSIHDKVVTKNIIPDNIITCDSSDDEELTLTDLKARNLYKKSLYRDINNTSLLILKHRERKAFVYRINHISKRVTDYFVLSNYELNTMFPEENKNMKHYCCWYSRENIINELELFICGTYSMERIKKFLRQPHSCLPGFCQCCCCVHNIYKNIKQGPKHKVTKNDFPAALSSNSRVLEKTSSDGHNDDPNRKAMCYNSKTHGESQNIPQEQKYTEFTLLSIEKVTSDITPNKISIEFYEIGRRGDVVRSFYADNHDEAKIIKDRYKLIEMQIIEKRYCCWYKRERILNDLPTFSPNALKFLRTPHACLTFNCSCCCKQKEFSATLQKRIKERYHKYGLPSFLDHTTTYNKKSINLKVSCNDSPKSIQHDYNIKLKNFKKLRLKVNNERKLEAVLDAPAKNLSLVELKILYHILAESSKQITQLQISPEEFCYWINLKQKNDSNDIQAVSPETTIPENTSNSLHDTEIPVNSNVRESKSEILTYVYQELSTIMKMKNWHLVNAFNIYFLKKNSLASSVMDIPEFRVFPAVPDIPIMPKIIRSLTKSVSEKKRPRTKPSTITAPARAECSNLSNDVIMQKIMSITDMSAEALTEQRLTSDTPSTSSAKTTTMIENTPAPASKKKPRQRKPKKSEINSTNCNMTADIQEPRPRTQKNKSKRKATPENGMEEKRIRVKSPSKLINTDPIQTPTMSAANYNMQYIPFTDCKTPILIDSRSLTTFQQNMSGFVGGPTYLLGDKMMTTQNLTSVVNTPDALQTFHSVNNTVGNSNQLFIVGDLNVSNNTYSANNVISAAQPFQEDKWMTFGPIPSTDNHQFGTMLSQMLKTPQVQPIVTPFGNFVPSLIPIRSSDVMTNLSSPTEVPQPTSSSLKPIAIRPKVQNNSGADLERRIAQSIFCNVLKDN